MVLDDAQPLFALFYAIYFAMIIGRSHEMYKPWDTYSAWKRKSHNINRLFAAWIITSGAQRVTNTPSFRLGMK